MNTETLIGKPVDRVDGRQKVTGSARYAADFPMKDVVHAVAFQSTIARGRITGIDASHALKRPGVIAVLTHENMPRLYPVSMEHNPGRPGQTFLPMQGDEIFYAGQYVGVVLADTVTQALEAAGLVKVSYREQKPTVHLEDALGQAYEPKKMGRGDKTATGRGDADKALAAAVVKIDQTYTTPIENHNPMEMSATLANWDKDRLTLYDATQWVYGVRAVVSTWLGIEAEKVRVIDPFVGGGFGCKGSMWPHIVVAAVASRHVGRPVKLMLTRSQMFSCIGYRPKTIQRVALGADAQGKLLATIHECTSQTSSWKEEWVESATKQTEMLYSCPNLRTVQRLAPVNANAPTQMRAPGHATGTFALEVAMDELAVATNVDPLELRLRNYAQRDEGENKDFSSKALRECYKQGAERFGWSKRNPAARSMRDGDTLIGWGMGTATYPTNRQESSAKVRLSADGRAVVSTAAHDLGTGTYTTMSQIAAEILGLPIEKVKVELADTVLPQAAVAGGSQTSASVGPPVKGACLKAIAALKERATADASSPLFKKQAREIGVGEGRIFLKDNPAVGETFVELLVRNGGRPVEGKSDQAPSGAAEQLDDAGAKKPNAPFSMHAFGAQFAEVRIDPRVGEIRVSRFVGAFGAGRILNAKTARSQIMGGIVWGISMALHEATIYDSNRGKIVNDNLADYLVPVNADIPEIDCFFVEEKDEHVNPLGVKGIGELGVTGAAAAVANAVFHATGKRLRDLPIRLEQVL
ncbi:MAG TPA: xanthine dehydrogenase family protein molybdopterin-binding subunit [Tepidisphaeraceae bacterium]|jgi:xanthine dehydrogenase YagR molybdenum-binding subunit|nr:xanthine dehydrogenase family protein molybdopterin-binding subunit [Tepidisphaeraceae bacterium]